MTETIHFKVAWVLYILWVVPPLAYGLYALMRRRRRAVAAFVSANRMRQLVPADRPGRDTLQLVCMTAGLCFALVAAAQPHWGMRETPVLEFGRDVMICLDVSRSMLARDVHPDRLRRAKADLLDLVRELDGDRAGIIAFRGGAVLLCPLTRDYRFLMQTIEGIDIDSAPPGGTDIAAGILRAIQAFDAHDSGGQSILLISDGEALEGDTDAAIEAARNRGIPVFTVGIGSREGAYVPDGQDGFVIFEGRRVVSKLNHEMLDRVAALTGGVYWPVERASTATITLGDLYRRHIRALDAQETDATQRRQAIARYQWFLLPGVILLTGAAMLSPGRPGGRRRTGARNGICLLATLAWLAAHHTTARADSVLLPSGRILAREAQRLFREGLYPEAADRFIEAARQAAATDRERYRLNAALAYLAAGNETAADAIIQTVRAARPEHRFLTAATRATIRYREAQDPTAEPDPANAAERRRALLQTAAAAFSDALRLAPTAEDRRMLRDNLAVVLSELPAAHRTAFEARLAREYGGQAPADLADLLLQRQRQLLRDTRAALDTETPERVTELERIALEQAELADAWIPLAETIDAALAQSDDYENADRIREAFQQLAAAAHDDLRLAARRLRDLDPDGSSAAEAGLDKTYGLWKALAPPSRLLAEDIRLQDTIGKMTESDPLGEDLFQLGSTKQSEAAALTELFRDRVEQGMQDPKTANIEPEVRDAILDLADRTIEAQKQAATRFAARDADGAREWSAVARDRLAAIEALLPEPDPPDGTPDENEEAGAEPEESGDDPEAMPPDKQDPAPAERDVTSGDSEDDSDDDMDAVERLLDRALEREQEHQEEKRRRQHRHPTHERDW